MAGGHAQARSALGPSPFNTSVSSCSSSTPAVPLTSAQFRLTSDAQVNKISAVASAKVTRTLAVSSTLHARCRRRSSVALTDTGGAPRSEEHTSELQSLAYLVCRLLLEKKKK